jgi:hypothetical protein
MMVPMETMDGGETPRPRGWSFVPLLVGRVLALRTGAEQVFLREEMGKLRSTGGAPARLQQAWRCARSIGAGASWEFGPA